MSEGFSLSCLHQYQNNSGPLWGGGFILIILGSFSLKCLILISDLPTSYCVPRHRRPDPGLGNLRLGGSPTAPDILGLLSTSFI